MFIKQPLANPASVWRPGLSNIKMLRANAIVDEDAIRAFSTIFDDTIRQFQ